MLKAAKSAQQAVSTINKPNASATGYDQDQTRKRAATAWVGLQQLFGLRFVRDYGDTPPRMWLRALHQLTDEQVGQGLDTLALSKRAHPPNLTEFVAVCRNPGGTQGPRYLGRPESAEQAMKRLNRPPADPGHVSACLERMREKLGGVAENPSRD